MAGNLLNLYKKHSGADSRGNFVMLDIRSRNRHALTKNRIAKFSVHGALAGKEMVY